MENLIIEKEILPDKDLIIKSSELKSVIRDLRKKCIVEIHLKLKNEKLTSDKKEIMDKLLNFRKIDLKKIPITREDAYNEE